MGRANKCMSFCLHKPFALKCACRVKFFCCSCSQTGEEDVSQFDSKFTRQTPVDSPVDSMLSESADKIFQVKKLMLWTSYSKECVKLCSLSVCTPHILWTSFTRPCYFSTFSSSLFLTLPSSRIAVVWLHTEVPQTLAISHHKPSRVLMVDDVWHPRKIV